MSETPMEISTQEVLAAAEFISSAADFDRRLVALEKALGGAAETEGVLASIDSGTLSLETEIVLRMVKKLAHRRRRTHAVLPDVLPHLSATRGTPTGQAIAACILGRLGIAPGALTASIEAECLRRREGGKRHGT